MSAVSPHHDRRNHTADVAITDPTSLTLSPAAHLVFDGGVPLVAYTGDEYWSYGGSPSALRDNLDLYRSYLTDIAHIAIKYGQVIAANPAIHSSLHEADLSRNRRYWQQIEHIHPDSALRSTRRTLSLGRIGTMVQLLDYRFQPLTPPADQIITITDQHMIQTLDGQEFEILGTNHPTDPDHVTNPRTPDATRAHIHRRLTRYPAFLQESGLVVHRM